LISHLCDVYTQVEEVDFDKGETTVYAMKEGEVEVSTKPVQKLEAIVANFHPDDAEKYTPNAAAGHSGKSHEDLLSGRINCTGSQQ